MSLHSCPRHSPVLLHLHLLLLLQLHVLLVAVVVALMHLVELAHVMVVGQRSKRIVVQATVVTVPHGGATKSAGTHLQCRGIDWQKRHRSAIKLINVNAADPRLELKQHRNAALASGDSQLIVLPIADTRRE